MAEKSRTDDKQLDSILKVSELLSNEAQGVSVVSQWAEYFDKRYGVELGSIAEYADNWRAYITIPVTAFNSYIGGLEATVVFLRNVHKLSYAEIGKLISRDPRTVWTAYRKAKEKMPFMSEPKSTKYHIPLHALADRNHTVLEIVCHVLKEHYQLKNHEIAKLIGRSDALVWITLRRYAAK